MIYRWFVSRRVRLVFAENSRGAWEMAYGLFADDVSFHYPGQHALAAEIHGRGEMAEWLERIKTLFPRLTFEIEQVVVNGWPWETRACTRFTACYTLSDGETVRSPGMQYLRIVWGKVKIDNLYLDTQTIASLLARSAAPGPGASLDATPGAQVLPG